MPPARGGPGNALPRLPVEVYGQRRPPAAVAAST